MKSRRDEFSSILLKEEKKTLTEIYVHQEIFWRQRLKQLWFKEGDQNSKYFHIVTKNR